ncbi:MAG TPA: bifunctional diaminohydroxyphosphoribosylaminopyrimidine deaminase/5-amino-6-(5-phosphoribosylamino)uracil reductase RibD [Planctomycetota bacterium]|nr:bifunctional diaminohydroxyphosphoribosylaminopyrimidine deaminase/5-amino-6-(5-phosphoribosylamino)uracil reductase RibD [Planctomycetota bacterium]
MNEEALMHEALDLAQRGRGEVEPNPRVGCILLQDGEVIGRGWHEFFGGRHAEAMALAEAGRAGRRPDTAIVTLEPCSTPKGVLGKKTEPCAQALVAAGVRRVVIGSVDPDLRHRRQGLAMLEQAGAEVVDGVLGSQCDAMNEPFKKALGLDRPWTLCKWAMTLDGKTAAPSGEARWISGPEARRRTHELRARCCGVMVGFRTAQIDDPELTVRHVDGRQPIRIVVDPLGEVDDDSNLVRTARQMPTWLLASEDVDRRRSGHLQDLGVTVIHIGTAEGPRRLHLGHAFRELHQRGLRRVLVEGGGGLVAQMLAWNCVDQVLAFVAPKIIGGKSSPTPVAGEGRGFMAEAWRLRDVRYEPCGEDLAVSGFL